MKQKYELTLTSNYASSWTIQDALRELIQNAIDQEVSIPDNKMDIQYFKNEETLIISNKSSVLEKKSLLLGYSSKTNDKDTIGQFGEGYKLGLLVLTRNNYDVTIYNYSNREVWNPKLIKSRRYGGEQILNIIVENEKIWKKVPDNNLTIKIKGISQEDYKELVERTLILQDISEDNIIHTDLGDILLNENHLGKVFVNGLFVNNIEGLKYGYNIKPEHIKIGRDRDLLSDFDVYKTTSKIWLESNKVETVNKLVDEDINDVRYIIDIWNFYSISDEEKEMSDKYYNHFVDKYGSNAYPVTSQNELKKIARNYSNVVPVVVNSIQKNLITTSALFTDKVESKLEKVTGLSLEERYDLWKSNYYCTYLDESKMNELDEIFKGLLNK